MAEDKFVEITKAYEVCSLLFNILLKIRKLYLLIIGVLNCLAFDRPRKKKEI